VSGRVVQRNALEQIQMLFSESNPFQLFEKHVMAQVHAKISAGGDSPAGVFEFLFMNIDWHVGVNEMFEAPGMVKVQVPNDHRFDIFDVISRGFDCSWKLLVFGILDAREDVCYGSTPFLLKS